jgi:HSP20 family protein
MSTITRYTPSNFPSLLEPEGFNQVFRRLWGDNLVEPMPRMLGWMPAVEIVENPEAILITAELPGLEIKDIQLTIEGDVLTLKGEKVREKKEDEAAKYHVFERFYGTFTRSFTLPRSVDVSKVKAEFNKGVLLVTLPKTAEAKGRVINILAK